MRPGDGYAQDFGAAADYPTGDACLFCHRNEIGATWLVNSHAWTIRPVGEPPVVARVLADDATHVIGFERHRALKQNGYGKFLLLASDGRWRAGVFERQCAGCHTTAVNAQTGEFSSYALDCYSCHGRVPEDHATRKGRALLSKSRKNPANEVISICGSCHLRGGRSKASGLPFPHQYVAGDDLFRDFAVDLRLDRKKKLDDSDAHVYVKARAVLEGDSKKTCTDCHKIHGPPEPKERDRTRFSEICMY